MNGGVAIIEIVPTPRFVSIRSFSPFHQMFCRVVIGWELPGVPIWMMPTSSNVPVVGGGARAVPARPAATTKTNGKRTFTNDLLGQTRASRGGRSHDGGRPRDQPAAGTPSGRFPPALSTVTR